MGEYNKVNKSSLKNGPRVNFRKFAVTIFCEWEDCTFSSTGIKELQEHVLVHLRDMYDKTNSSGNEPSEMKCHICHDYLPADFSCIRHAYYHVYHFNLKSRGRHIKKIYNLGDCNLDNEFSNAVPPLTHPFICQWKGCEYSNDSISDFYEHVDDHPFYEGGDPENPNIFECKWVDCKYTTVTVHRLLTHMSIHCEKRYIACPNCGLCFATTAKFMDHLRRQVVTIWNKEMQELEMKTVLSNLASTNNPVIPVPKPVVQAPPEAFQCNLCMHLFATKQMLKYHETRHISTLVCPHCNISCASRHALKRHILFRHTEEKPFKCDECDMAFKCNDVLRRHTLALHQNENFNPDLKCDAVNCAYAAKSKHALSIHKSRMHLKVQTIVTKVYVCHKCDQEYVKGALLTMHLSKDHGIKKTSNRYRHQYKICEDGKYRLSMFDLKLRSVVKEKMNLVTNTTKPNQSRDYDVLGLKQVKKENQFCYEMPAEGGFPMNIDTERDYDNRHRQEIDKFSHVDEILDVGDLDCSF